MNEKKNYNIGVTELYQAFKMSKILALVLLCHFLKMSWGAIDTSVIVFGTTVGPNFQRPEGMGRYSTKFETNVNLSD